jgi:hypothetical protein
MLEEQSRGKEGEVEAATHEWTALAAVDVPNEVDHGALRAQRTRHMDPTWEHTRGEPSCRC